MRKSKRYESYHPWAAYPTRAMAEEYAAGAKTRQGSPCFEGAIPRVRVVDQGPGDRLRFLIEIACPLSARRS